MDRTGQRWGAIGGLDVRRDEQEAAQRTEFRMLRRPESKESEELSQQLSLMGVQESEARDDEDEGSRGLWTLCQM